jgi:hypothetical protein
MKTHEFKKRSTHTIPTPEIKANMNLSSKKRPTPSLFAALTAGIALAAIVVTGCSSMGQPASASFASVQFSGKSAKEIRDTTMAVFREESFRVFIADSGQLVFDREGSRANAVARNGLVAAQAGSVTVVRVRADVVELAPATHRLHCQAYMVTDADDAFFEQEDRLANFRSGPYQKLLDEVARRLK